LAPSPASAATLPSGVQTGFQIDGNKTSGSPPNTFDWDDILSTPQSGSSFTFTPTAPYTTAIGDASSGVTQGAFYWDNGTLDDACSGKEATGQPGSQSPNTNPWVPGSANPNDKGNICSSGYAVEAVTHAGRRHTILYGYWTRRTGAPAAVSVFNLFEGPKPGRCDDLLLQVDYPGGTTNFLTWTPTAGDNCANPLGAGSWAASNRTIDFAFAMGNRTEGAPVNNSQEETFGEYAIDLTTAGLFNEEECSAFTVSTTFSRTGTGVSATIQDFLLNSPGPLELSNCGTLSVTKRVTPPGTTDDTFRVAVSSDEGPIQLGPPPVDVIEGSLQSGQTLTYQNVRAGTQTHIDEVGIPSPWVKQSVVCSYRDSTGQTHDINVTVPTTPFPIPAGGRTDCVITNNAALVTITKQTIPDRSTTPFSFDVDGRTVQLRDDESQTIAFAPDTEVTISEDAVPGWLAPDISCTSTPVQTADRSVTITAKLGQNIQCTFTNTQLGTVIITKEAHGVDGRTFQFEGTFPGAEDGFEVLVENGDGTLYNTTFPNIPPGSYSVTELEDTGDPPMIDSDVSCTYGGADHSFPPEQRTGRFTVLPGETVRCFFTNSLPQKLFVIKRTLPVEFNEQFQFSMAPSAGGTPTPFILNGNSDGPPAGALWSSPSLDAGQYTITESPKEHWTVDDITCTADEDVWNADVTAGKVTVDLPAGETVTCFFTDKAAPARATLTKTVRGIADNLAWGFDVAISPEADVSPTSAQRVTGTGPGTDSVTWNNLVPGQQYTISEPRQPGWQMGPMTCTDADDPSLTDLDDEELTFSFVAHVGQQLTCEMTNTGTAPQLRLTKVTSGIGFDYPWQFDFAIDPVPTDEVAQKAVEGVGQTSDIVTWQQLLPGQTYTLTELGDLDGITASVTCDNLPRALRGPSFQFTAPLGGTVDCVAIDLAEPVAAKITKTSVGGDGTFTYTLTPPVETGLEPQVLEITTSDGSGTGGFADLIPGQHYSLTETEDAAWQQTGLTCTATAPDGTTVTIPDLTDFVVRVGQTVACSATNTLRTNSVAITKVVEGVAEDFQWSFELALTDAAGTAHTEVASGTGNTSIPVSWTGLAPGTYALSEATVDGWKPATTVCLAGDVEVDSGALVIGAGNSFTCTVTNSPQPGQLTITKSVLGVADNLAWAFKVGIVPTPGDEPESVDLTNASPAHTWSALTPGVVYTLTEVVPAGWTGHIECEEGSRGDAAAGYEVVAQPGGSVACSIENTATAGSGVITKSAAGGDGSFDVVLQPLPTGQPTTITVTTQDGTGTAQLPDLLPGASYSLTEVEQPDWESGQLTCTATPPGGSARDLDVDNFTVAPGEVLACSARNEALGSLTLTKTVENVAEGLNWQFAFTLDSARTPPEVQVITGSGPHSGTASWTDLVPGQTYTLSEATRSDWTAEDFACAGVSDLDPDSPGWQFTPQPGQEIACTATNQANSATGTITKSTTGRDGSFDFVLQPLPTGQPTTITVTTQGGSGSADLPELLPGASYSLAETDKPGWTAGQPTCTATPPGGPARTLDISNFTVAPGEVLACSMSNEAMGSLTLTKPVEGVAEGFAWQFVFTLASTGSGPEPRSLTGSGPHPATVSWSDLLPGRTYTLDENATAGWTLQDLTCAGLSDLDPETPGWQFIPTAGQEILCTATNRANPATGTITKTTSGGDGNFTFQLRPLPNGQPTTVTVTTEGGSGTAELPSLTPGTTYALSETHQQGWAAGELTCTATPPGGEARELDVDGFTVAPGEVLACQAQNQALVSLTLTKSVDGVAEGFAWQFAFTLDPAPSHTVAGSGPHSGAVSWTDLVPGTTYTLSEDVRDGWTSDGLTCTGLNDLDPETPGWQVTPQNGQEISCTSTNRATAGSGVITKSTTSGDDSFDFLLRPLPDGQPTTITVTTEDHRGSADLPSLVPGTMYALAEPAMEGWTRGELTCTATPAGGGEARTLDVNGFTVAPGDVLACAVRNQRGATPPTGPVPPTEVPPSGPIELPVVGPEEMPVTGMALYGIAALGLTLFIVGAVLLGSSWTRLRRQR
jgi:hypothetical protein